MNVNNIVDIIENKKNWKLRLDKFYEKVKKAECICLFGAGRLGIEAYKILKNNDIKVKYFCDNNRDLWGKRIIDDAYCISTEELKKMCEKVLIIITIENYNIYNQLKSMNMKKIFNIFWFKYDNRDFFDEISLDEVSEKIIILNTILEDNESKYILNKTIERWVENDCFYNDLEAVTKMYESIENQNEYFDSKIIQLKQDEVYIDVGAYDGDTIDEFLNITNNKFEKIIAFELEKKNYEKLRANVSRYSSDIQNNITLYNKGLYNTRAFVTMTSERDNVTISEVVKDKQDTILAEVVELSDILEKNQKVTYIKMDIEGSEMEALMGASEVIKQWKPKLAICIYHKPEHYWQIPLFIKSLVPEYKIYIRHHSKMAAQTVCYAVI